MGIHPYSIVRYCIQCGKLRKDHDLFCKDCFSTYRQIVANEQDIIQELIEAEIEALDPNNDESLRRLKRKLLKIKSVLDEEAKKIHNTRANVIQFISALNEKILE